MDEEDLTAAAPETVSLDDEPAAEPANPLSAEPAAAASPEPVNPLAAEPAAPTPPAAPASPAAPAAASAAAPVQTVDIGTPAGSLAGAGATGWAALNPIVEAVEKSGSIGDLEVLLKHEVVAAMAGEQAESVRRSVQYAEGVIRQGETLLTGWPVLAVNEWGVQQERVLLLTSQGLYRIAYQSDKGRVHHYTRTSLGALKRLEFGRCAFKIVTTEPDGAPRARAITAQFRAIRPTALSPSPPPQAGRTRSRTCGPSTSRRRRRTATRRCTTPSSPTASRRSWPSR